MRGRHLQAEYMILEKAHESVYLPTKIFLLQVIGWGETREKAEKTLNKYQLLNINNKKSAL